MFPCTRRVFLTCVGACALCAGSVTAAPPSYNAVNISTWSAQQLQALPFFKHFRPATLPIPGAPTDFYFVSRTSSGFLAGSTWNVFTGPDQRGVLMTPTGANIIDSFGDFHWWRTTPPASATYRIANANDVNWAGTVVGWANLPGTSQTSQQGPDTPAITYTVAEGKTRLFPGTPSASANCINNRGEIAGVSWGGTDTSPGAFRRATDGTLTQLGYMPPGYSVTPQWINAEGVIIGKSVPGGFVSPSDSTIVPLARLFGMPLATTFDLNDAGWVVGTSESWDHTEQYATIWEPDGAGNWTPRDLTDVLNTSGILLDRAVAINNAGQIIAVGHTDTATPVYSAYLLQPVGSASTTCVPDIGLHPSPVSACGTAATFSVQVVNPTGATTYQWRKDGADIDPGSNPSAATATLTIPSVSDTFAGEYDCAVTNACGSTVSNAVALTATCTPTCDPIDFNNDGLFPDTADIDDFLSVFSGGPCSTGTCNDVDFNNDGLFPDTADIDSLLSVFSGGECIL